MGGPTIITSIPPYLPFLSLTLEYCLSYLDGDVTPSRNQPNIIYLTSTVLSVCMYFFKGMVIFLAPTKNRCLEFYVNIPLRASSMQIDPSMSVSVMLLRTVPFWMGKYKLSSFLRLWIYSITNLDCHIGMSVMLFVTLNLDIWNACFSQLLSIQKMTYIYFQKFLLTYTL